MKNYYIGVIEDRRDPEKLGRFRVRVLGLHPIETDILPTTDLPWATVITPSGGNSGFGFTPPFFVPGTWVYVTYRDEDRQEPLIHGSLSGIPDEAGSIISGQGFRDPFGLYPVEANKSDVSELARGETDAVNPTTRHGNRKTGVATADFDGFEIPTVGDNLSVVGSAGGSFDMPAILNGTYAPSYPFNHVFTSEAGHVLEFDDTTDKRRVQLSHSSGTYMEMSNDGTIVNHSISDKYDVVNSKRFEFIGNDSVTSIDGALKVKVNKSDSSGNHYDIEVGSGANLNIMVRQGDLNMNVKGNVNQFIDGDLNASMDNIRLDASNKITMTAGGQIKIDGGSVDIDGTPIDLN
jgi:hypothetical protein